MIFHVAVSQINVDCEVPRDAIVKLSKGKLLGNGEGRPAGVALTSYQSPQLQSEQEEACTL